MSYWVSLEVNNETVEVPNFEEGGTQTMGGSTEASLNITYNYAEVYRLLGFSLRDLHGHNAKGSVPLLERSIAVLGTRQYADYWAPTPGNAGHALNILLGWARLYPDATWGVMG